MPSVTELYEQELAARGFQPDPAQLRAVQVLQDCADEWQQYLTRRDGRGWLARRWGKPPALPRGVYMHGGVGRGKSFLMDCFFHAVAVPGPRKTRLHFHEFMREVHRELGALQGTPNPLQVLGQRMAERFDLLCFDEFHIADITNAMILHRMLVALRDSGVGFVTTSNFRPDGLYPDGLHRDRILPAIDLLNATMHVVNVDNGTDYRRRTLEQVALYHSPLDAAAQQAMQTAFVQLAATHEEDAALHIESRPLPAIKRAGGVVWFDFKTLCASPRSQNDYLEIATRFHTLLLSDVPQMSVAQASEARRFTLLIDVLYDRRVKLVMSAAVPPEQLYTQGPLAHEFPRTVSRLQEMQSAEYLALEHRTVNTQLT